MPRHLPDPPAFPAARRRWRRLRLIAALALLASAVAGACAGSGCADGDATCLRVLFVGNSYTFTNDLPGTFARLASAGGHRVETGMVAAGGATLEQLAGSADLARVLAARPWNVAILQEQSQIPAVAASRAASMLPAARTLVDVVRARGATPALLLTWGYRDGWPGGGFAAYPAMQAALTAGYRAVARQLGVPVVPAGEAWAVALRGGSGADLWQADGSHPTVEGTYLAACTLYAAVFGASPEGVGFTDGLDAALAAQLQHAAATVALADPGSWGIPAR